MKNKLFLDVHAIQILPPSNINRDDTGSPKTALYGGARRARVSSQSWKRAMREYFRNNGESFSLGVRTLDVVRYVADKIKELDPEWTDDEAMTKADKIINEAGIKTKDKKAKALVFIGDEQAKKLAQAAIDDETDKKELKDILKNNPAVDVALFGRMVADDPSLNEDASAQVAHSISTHAVQTEYDFYTAVDDLAPEDNAGAGMLGTIEFNSSTLYRYANVAIHELLSQLVDKEKTVDTVKLFVDAFANSLPTGKVNTFANQTLPQVLIVTLRSDRPINLVTAFEKPVKSNDGYIEKSIEKLTEEFEKTEKFVEKPIENIFVSFDKNVKLEEIAEKQENLTQLLNNMGEYLEKYIDENLA